MAAKTKNVFIVGLHGSLSSDILFLHLHAFHKHGAEEAVRAMVMGIAPEISMVVDQNGIYLIRRTITNEIRMAVSKILNHLFVFLFCNCAGTVNESAASLQVLCGVLQYGFLQKGRFLGIRREGSPFYLGISP